jgi:type II secretory pathway component PulF
MAEFVIKVADERGRVQEQVQTAATADELRARFVHAGPAAVLAVSSAARSSWRLFSSSTSSF